MLAIDCRVEYKLYNILYDYIYIKRITLFYLVYKVLIRLFSTTNTHIHNIFIYTHDRYHNSSRIQQDVEKEVVKEVVSTTPSPPILITSSTTLIQFLHWQLLTLPILPFNTLWCLSIIFIILRLYFIPIG